MVLWRAHSLHIIIMQVNNFIIFPLIVCFQLRLTQNHVRLGAVGVYKGSLAGGVWWKICFIWQCGGQLETRRAWNPKLQICISSDFV